MENRTLRNISLHANLWTSRTGNTYHRVYLTVECLKFGVQKFVSAITYGGMSHYLHTTGEYLAQEGFAEPGTEYSAVRTLARSGSLRTFGKDGIQESTTIVRRKKDL